MCSSDSRRITVRPIAQIESKAPDIVGVDNDLGGLEYRSRCFNFLESVGNIKAN